MKETKVAVITRTKNRNVLLQRALQSVKNQTFKNYIHVIINDGGSRGDVDKLIEKHGADAIKVVHNEESLGLTPALNKAILSVESEYVAILDDDDSWDPSYLELMVEYLERSKSKGVVAVIDRVVEEIIDNKIVKRLSVERWRPDIKAVSLYGQCIDNYAPTVAFVYRRDVYNELNGYDETLGVSEDWEFTIRFLLKYDIGFLETKKALAFYHHRPKMSGSLGNSVFDRVDQHRYSINMLANKFLREDLQKGKFGVGYIINNLRYQQDVFMQRESARELEQTIRLENHINYVSRILRQDIASDTDRAVRSHSLIRLLQRFYRRITLHHGK